MFNLLPKLFLNDFIPDTADGFDRAFHRIAGLEHDRWLPEIAHPRGGSGSDHVTGNQRNILADELDNRGNIENKITRVGGDKDIKVNVRVVAATNKDLKEEIKEKKFREDLYHRIGVILIHVPPLRERKEDVALLVDKFLEDISGEYGSKKCEIETKAIEILQSFEWTGNIRELRNVTERLVIMCGNKITAEDVKKYS